MKLKFKHVDQLSNNKKARVAYRVIRLLPVLNAFFDSEDVPENSLLEPDIKKLKRSIFQNFLGR